MIIVITAALTHSFNHKLTKTLRLRIHRVLKTNDIDAQDRERGATTLHIACESGATKIVKALLRRNADVYMRDKEGRTCLHGAVKRCQHGAVKALLKSSAASAGDLVNTEDFQGRTPMHLAAEGGDMKMLHRLVKAGRGPTYASAPGHFCRYILRPATGTRMLSAG